MSMLHTQIPEHLHKPLLDVIHHSTKSLDGLVDECYRVVFSRTQPGEPVVQLTRESGLSRDESRAGEQSGGQCESPSSDKENSATTTSSSPSLTARAAGETAKTNGSLRPEQQQRKINTPALVDSPSPGHCTSAVRVPPREVLCSFISWCASRDEPASGSVGAWTVAPAMFVKHALKNKIAPMFLPLSERKRVQAAHSNTNKKHKLTASRNTSSTKRQKVVQQERQLVTAVGLTAGAQVQPAAASDSSARAGTTGGVVRSLFGGAASVGGVSAVRRCSWVNGASTKEAAAAANSSDAAATTPAITNGHASPHTQSAFAGDTQERVVEHSPPTSQVGKAAVCGNVGEEVDSDDSDNVTLIKLVSSTSKIDELKRKAELRRAKNREKRRERKARQLKLSQSKNGGGGGAKSPLKKPTDKSQQQQQQKQNKTWLNNNNNGETQNENTRTSSSSSSSAAAAAAGKTVSSKAMRQMSLFDMGRQSTGKAGKSQGKSSSTATAGGSILMSSHKRPLPPCVRKLTQLLEAGNKTTSCQYYLNMCVKYVPRSQLARVLHVPTRAIIERRMNAVEEARKMARMTPEQRKQYQEQKKLDKKNELKIYKEEQKMCFEDQLLTGLKPLPAASAVELPEQLPASSFGRVLLVTEFISAYWPLLLPGKTTARHSHTADSPVLASQLILSLVASSDSQQFQVFLDTLALLVRPLLTDVQYAGLTEWGYNLCELEVNALTAPELFRLLMRLSRSDASSAESLLKTAAAACSILAPDTAATHKIGASCASTVSTTTTTVSTHDHLLDSIVDRLATVDLDELSAEARLHMLCVLVDRVLQCEAVACYQEQLEERHRQLWTSRNQVLKQRREMASASDVKQTADSSSTSAAAETTEPGAVADQSEEGESRRSRRHRLSVEEAQKQRQLQLQEDQKKRCSEIEQARRQQQDDAILAEFADVCGRQVAALRRGPLGLDRLHRRYWLLASAGAPGVYVESGWACSHTLPDSDTHDHHQEHISSVNHDDDDDDKPLAAVSVTSSLEEYQGSYPAAGVNTWLRYSSLAAVDELLASLTACGKREASLKNALIAARASIELQFKTADSASVQSAAVDEASAVQNADDCPANTTNEHNQDEPMEQDQTANANATAVVDDSVVSDAGEQTHGLLAWLRRDLLQLERRLSDGYLGGIPACAGRQQWQQRVRQAVEVAALTDALLVCHSHVARRAMCAPLAPSAGRTRELDDVKTDVQQERRASDASGIKLGHDAADTSSTIIDQSVSRHGASLSQRERAWCEAVRQCGTAARLHVLLHVLDASINWGLSATDKKCRVCRRAAPSSSQAPADVASVCAGCLCLYHWRCVRPVITSLPSVDWRCSSCKPREKRSSARVSLETGPVRKSSAKRERSADEQDGGTEDERQQAECKESECRVCGQGDDGSSQLIVCPQCPAAFHKHCHQPPVLLRIRAGWQCMDCQAMVCQRPTSRRARGSSCRSAKPLPSEILRAASRDDVGGCGQDETVEHSGEDGDGNESGSDESREQKHSTRARSVRSSRPRRSASSVTSRKRSTYISDDDEDDEEDIIDDGDQDLDDEDFVCGVGRSGLRRRSASRSSRSSKRARECSRARSSGRSGLRPSIRRPVISSDEDEDVEEMEDASAEEARIRQLSTDDDGDVEEQEQQEDEEPGRKRRVCWRPSSPVSRRRQIRASRQQRH